MECINTCGLSCPQPVLMVYDAEKKGHGPRDVLVDNEASHENVKRAAAKLGYTVAEEAQPDGVWRLELR